MSEEVICHEVELDWVKSFTALGINYDVTNLQGITELNCKTKMIEVEKVLLSWSRRNTTIAGRVLVIKSLALSKLVHFFISLPTPSQEFMREINKKFYYFLWKGKPPKIKSKTMELNIENGGLKMINVDNFEQMLKTKWLKKMLTSNDDWTTIPHKYGIDNICRYGPDYIQSISTKIKNPFWASVSKALTRFHKIYLKEYPHILPDNEPIWFNPRFQLPYIKKWDQKGLRNVGDLIDKNGVLKTSQKLEDDFGITINFLEFMRISKAIPKNVLGREKEEDAPWCQPFVLNILNDSKTNKNIKNTFSNENKTVPTANKKWEELLLAPGDELNWKSIYLLPPRCTQNKWMQMFQFKILHRILPTNKKTIPIQNKNVKRM